MSRQIPDTTDPAVQAANRIANNILGKQLAARWAPSRVESATAIAATATVAAEAAAAAAAATAAGTSGFHVTAESAATAMAIATTNARAAQAAVQATVIGTELAAKRRRTEEIATEEGNSKALATYRLLVRPPGLTDDAQWEAKAADFYGTPSLRNTFEQKEEWLGYVNIDITDDDHKFNTCCALCHLQGNDEHLESCARDGAECFRVVAWETKKFYKIKERTALKQRTQAVIDARAAALERHNEKVRLAREAEEAASNAMSSAANAAARANNAFGFTRKTTDQKEFERCEKACVAHYFHNAIYPELKAEVRINGRNKRRRHDNCCYLMPNPHTVGTTIIREMYGKTHIPTEMRNTLYQVIGDNKLHVLAPEIFFPKHFDVNKIVCPQCDMIATPDSPYQLQGFAFDPKVGFGLGSERFYIMSSAYSHVNCGDGTSAPKVTKFQLADPKVMDQLSPVVTAAYDFVVRRQSLFTRERVMQQDLLKELGVSAKAYNKMRGKIEEKKKDVQMSARMDIGKM